MQLSKIFKNLVACSLKYFTIKTKITSFSYTQNYKPITIEECFDSV